MWVRVNSGSYRLRDPACIDVARLRISRMTFVDFPFISAYEMGRRGDAACGFPVSHRFTVKLKRKRSRRKTSSLLPLRSFYRISAMGAAMGKHSIGNINNTV